jgi:putative ABC transport system permease protein
MKSLGEIARRLWFLLNRDRVAAELEEEMRLHRDLRAAKLADAGASVSDAAAEARMRFGNVGAIEEQSHDAWGLRWVEHAVSDARFALRRLRHRPAFAFSTIAVIALGIGATTAVFSAVDAALIRPLPFLRPSELVSLTSVRIPSATEASRAPGDPHSVEITALDSMPDLFASVAAFATGGLNLSDNTHPRRVTVGVVSSGFFKTLGVSAKQGRTFDESEGKPDAGHVVILSDALWRTQFGSEDVLGRQIDLNGDRYTVVGIMPSRFSFPSESELWIPLSIPTTSKTFQPFRGYLPTEVIARLAPGVSRETVSNRLVAMWVQAATPRGNRPRYNIDDVVDDVRANGAAGELRQTLVGDRRRALLVLMGATVLLLLIGCANAANLLLSDGASRGREVALRAVLGASSERIMRQFLVESCALAITGAFVGVAIAPVALGVLRAAMPSDLAGVADASLDMRVLIFATLVALVTGVAFGFWPAISAVRGNRAETIKAGGGAGGTTLGIGSARRLLIVAELALTIVLLIGAGLMLKSLGRLMSQRLGLNPQNVGTAELTFAGNGGWARQLAVMHAILDRLSADPAIAGAGVVNDVPLRGNGGISVLIDIAGAPKRAKGSPRFARFLFASGGYFKAMGIPLVRGRTFTASDTKDAPPTVIISETMAKRWWPGVDPIGQTFRLSGDTVNHFTVVGIVGDVRDAGLDRNMAPQLYLSIDRGAPQSMGIVARGSLSSSALLSRIESAVRAADPSQPVYNLRMMESVITKSVAPQRTSTTLIAAFGALALAVSAFGVYAVVSYSVSRRAREFGIRSALGATGINIAGLVGRELFSAIVIGTALGLLGAWVLSRVLQSMLFGVGVHDFSTFAVVPFVLAVPALVAMLPPARRAARINPADVMRAE